MSWFTRTKRFDNLASWKNRSIPFCFALVFFPQISFFKKMHVKTAHILTAMRALASCWLRLSVSGAHSDSVPYCGFSLLLVLAVPRKVFSGSPPFTEKSFLKPFTTRIRDPHWNPSKTDVAFLCNQQIKLWNAVWMHHVSRSWLQPCSKHLGTVMKIKSENALLKWNSELTP